MHKQYIPYKISIPINTNPTNGEIFEDIILVPIIPNAKMEFKIMGFIPLIISPIFYYIFIIFFTLLFTFYFWNQS